MSVHITEDCSKKHSCVNKYIFGFSNHQMYLPFGNIVKRCFGLSVCFTPYEVIMLEEAAKMPEVKHVDDI